MQTVNSTLAQVETTHMLQNSKLQEQITQNMIDQKNQEKLMLGTFYKNQIDDNTRKRVSDFESNKQEEQRLLNRPQFDPSVLDIQKRMAYKNELDREMNQKSKQKELETLLKHQGNLDARKGFKKYADEEEQRNDMYYQKFRDIDSKMSMIGRNYQQNVLSGHRNKNMSLNDLEQRWANEAILKQTVVFESQERNRRDMN